MAFQVIWSPTAKLDLADLADLATYIAEFRRRGWGQLRSKYIPSDRASWQLSRIRTNRP